MKILGENTKKIGLNIITTILVVLIGFVSASAASEIHGMTWNDTNYNGIMEVSEAGIPDITICYNNTLAGSSACTITDVTGNYTFTGLDAGDYAVYEILPADTYLTYPTCRNCTSPTISGVGSAYHFVTLSGTTGESITDINFGNKKITPPPPDVTVMNQVANQDGIPVVYRPMLSAANPLTIQKNLSGVTGTILSVTVTFVSSDGTTITANMNNPAGAVWEASIPPPPGGFSYGLAEMTFYVDVSPLGQGSEDVIQIGDILLLDPSGNILDACTGEPIDNATVTLYVQNITGDFNIITTGINPSKNPIITGLDGSYSWMVPAGTYKVKAEKSGYLTNWSNPVTITSEPVTGVNISLTPLGGCSSPYIDVINNIPSDPVPVGTIVTPSASFTDPDIIDTYTAVWNWGGTQGTSSGIIEKTGSSGVVTGSHIYDIPGIYTIQLTVTDASGRSDTAEATQYVVVYDPNGGFVTGGGWINSSAGSYTTDPSLTGKANFGFVSKYQKGTTIPTGETDFQFNVANLSFKSNTYEWLVISGARAQYKGSGTINGTGDYGFILTAIDGQISGGGGTDKFRIKIQDKATGQIVYDNQMGAADTADPTTVIGGGSIVIHKS